DGGVIDVGVAIRGGACAGGLPAGVGRFDGPLDLLAGAAGAAAEADDAVQAAVQVEHAATAGALVQAVDVLGQQQVDPAVSFERGQGVVGGVGLGADEARPPDGAARPVASVGGVAAGQGLQGDGLGAFPVSIAVAIVGNARAGAAAGAGQDEKAFVPAEPVAQASGGGRVREREVGGGGHAA